MPAGEMSPFKKGRTYKNDRNVEAHQMSAATPLGQPENFASAVE